MSDNSSAAMSAVASTHDAALVTMGFSNLASFEFMQRTAKLFAVSTMVPAPYQAVVSVGYGREKKWEQNPAAISNCMVALDLAQRMKASPLQVMQNLHVIEGRPSWSSSFIIALINNSGLYSHNLRFRYEEFEEITAYCTSFEWVNNVKTTVRTPVKVLNARCVAWTKDKATGDIIESPPVTIELAVQEGWYTRNGSKWPTMPQLMLQYRAAAFFGRAQNPELMMGLPTVDEVHDVIDVEPQADGTYAAPPTPPTDMAAEAAAGTEVAKPRPPTRKSAAAKAAEATEATNVKDVVQPAQASADAITPGVDTEPVEVADGSTAAQQQAQPAQGSLVDDAPQVAAIAPAANPAPVAKPLSTAKINFVIGQMEAKKIATEQFQAKFDVLPAELNEKQFPDVLAWLKEQNAPDA